MKVKKAYRFKLKINTLQSQQLRTYAGHCRFLWNKFLGINLKRLQNKQAIMRYHEMDFWSKLYKQSDEFGFLSECPAHILQQKLKDLDCAFLDAFDKKQPNKRMPRFRKKGLQDSFRFPAPNQVQLDYNRIKLPKIGWLRFFRSQAVDKDYLHKISTRLSKNHAMIVIEDLQVSNMSRSASGNIESPGRNVSAKSGLNKSILDQGWYEFRRQLNYKLEWQGGTLMTVKPHYTSQKCSVCHHTAKGNRLSQSEFKCEVCGFECHADINASHNILAAGHVVLACGASA